MLLADEVVHAVAKAYEWPVLQPQPKAAMTISAATMRGFAGKYAANLGGERVKLDVAIGREAGADVLLVNSPLTRQRPFAALRVDAAAVFYAAPEPRWISRATTLGASRPCGRHD